MNTSTSLANSEEIMWEGGERNDFSMVYFSAPTSHPIVSLRRAQGPSPPCFHDCDDPAKELHDRQFTETLSHTTARFVPSFFTLHSSLFTVNSFAFLASLFWTEVRFLCFVFIEIECVEPLGLNARTSRHCCAFSHAMYSQYLPSPFTFRSRVCESLLRSLDRSWRRRRQRSEGVAYFPKKYI